MWQTIHQAFTAHPIVVLFLTISLGYLVGKFKYKTFVLGGISGSLLMGVLIGQFGVDIPIVVRTTFFALFIYAVGGRGNELLQLPLFSTKL
jgi:putative transport protein